MTPTMPKRRLHKTWVRKLRPPHTPHPPLAIDRPRPLKLGRLMDWSWGCTFVVDHLSEGSFFEFLNPIWNRKEVDFSKVQGKRYHDALRMLADLCLRSALIILVLVLEPLRCVTAWLMRRAQEVEDPCRVPAILNLFDPARSVVTSSRQYLATLLHGGSSRLLLLWRMSGCDSYVAWCRDRPQDKHETHTQKPIIFNFEV